MATVLSMLVMLVLVMVLFSACGEDKSFIVLARDINYKILYTFFSGVSKRTDNGGTIISADLMLCGSLSRLSGLSCSPSTKVPFELLISLVRFCDPKKPSQYKLIC